MIGRRELISGTLVAIAPRGLAHAQERARQPLVAVLSAASETAANRSPVLPNLIAGLREHGYDPGRNLRIEFRFADGDLSRLPMLARELVGLQPDVLFTSGTPGARAAVAAAGGRVPVVVGPAAEITMSALVPNYARPEANVTGFTLEAPEQDAKTIEFLKACVPAAKRMAVLVQPDNPVFKNFVAAMSHATRALDVELFEVGARNAMELQGAISSAVSGKAGAILAANDGLMMGDALVRGQIVALTLQARLPSASTSGDYARDGGLLALSVDTARLARRAARYVHLILQGSRPADLPVERPTTVMVIVNLKTARALGIDVPAAVLARADEVIE